MKVKTDFWHTGHWPPTIVCDVAWPRALPGRAANAWTGPTCEASTFSHAFETAYMCRDRVHAHLSRKVVHLHVRVAPSASPDARTARPRVCTCCAGNKLCLISTLTFGSGGSQNRSHAYKFVCRRTVLAVLIVDLVCTLSWSRRTRRRGLRRGTRALYAARMPRRTRSLIWQMASTL